MIDPRFCDNVVLDSRNMAFKDENDILDQICENECFRIYIMTSKNFSSMIYENDYLHKAELKPNI